METGSSYVVLAVLKLIMLTKLTFNSQKTAASASSQALGLKACTTVSGCLFKSEYSSMKITEVLFYSLLRSIKNIVPIYCWFYYTILTKEEK